MRYKVPSWLLFSQMIMIFNVELVVARNENSHILIAGVEDLYVTKPISYAVGSKWFCMLLMIHQFFRGRGVISKQIKGYS